MQFSLPTLTFKNPEPPAPTQSDEAPRPNEAAQEAKRRDAAFDEALKDQLEKKDAPYMPLTLPWLVNQAVQPAEAEQVVDAAAAVTNRTAAPAPIWTPPAAFQLAGAQDNLVDLEVAPVKSPAEEAEFPTEVAVVVEAGLPIAQPTVSHAEGPVPLADFPQVVVGKVQQMNKDNQPLTQLDFEISPPHVGPVNLQISLQNGAVNVQLVALTMQAKQALESQVGNIQTILQAHNLNPGQVKVVTAANGRSGAGGTGQRGDQPTNFGLLNGGRKRGGAQEDGKVQA